MVLVATIHGKDYFIEATGVLASLHFEGQLKTILRETTVSHTVLKASCNEIGENKYNGFLE